MGYHSTIELNVTVGKVDEIRKYLDDIKEKDNSGKGTNKEFEISLLEIKENWLTTSDGFAKWNYYDEWIEEIAKFDLSGSIEFVGEDGCRWGFMFEDDGIYDIEYSQKKGKKLYSPTPILDQMVENTVRDAGVGGEVMTNPQDTPDEYYVELLENLCDYCGYFNSDAIVNNGYGCDHPDNGETAIVKINKHGEQEWADGKIESKIINALLREKYGSVRQIREALKTEEGKIFWEKLKIQVLCDTTLYKRFANYKLQGMCYSFSCPLASVCDLEALKEHDQEWYDEYKNDEYDPSESGADLMLVNKKILTKE